MKKLFSLLLHFAHKFSTLLLAASTSVMYLTYTRSSASPAPRRKLLCCVYIIFSGISPLISEAASTVVQWKMVTPGIDYTRIENPQSHSLGYIHCFKINLQQNTLQLALAKDDLFPAETVKWLAQRNHALIAVNGGFFTSEWEPIGLRIQQKNQRSPLQPTSWWPVFYLKNNMPHIVQQKDFKKDPEISFAVQGGPPLLLNGKIPSLKLGNAERTALGITNEGEVIILATEQWKLSTDELAHIFQEKLNCIQAMNLDGGSSTQLYANMGDFQLNVSSLALIADIIYVIPQK